MLMIKCKLLFFFFLILVNFILVFRINISVLEFVKNLPQFDKNNYESARLPF